jgi:hypothetical protein
MTIEVDTTEFKQNVRKYAVAVGKDIDDAVKEEAKLTCQRIMQFTPPKNQAQGRRRVKSDIERVYLTPSWFEDTYQFSSERLGERVKSLVRGKQDVALDAIFENSPKLRRIHIESFSAATHKKFRRNGRVGKGVAPFSFPLQQQSQVKSYSDKKQKNVGLVKSGWGACLVRLGGSVAGWLSKRSSNGSVEYQPDGIVMTNKVGIASQVDGRGQFARKALIGRQRDLQKKIDAAIKGTVWGKVK